MASRTLQWISSALLLAHLGASSPTSKHKDDKPAAFFLAGDSTTAVQSTGGGGWGNGFLATLQSPAYGANKGHNGATTVSFVKGGDWATVLNLVKNATDAYNVYVTIQFGHNDQKPGNNVPIPQFKTNLATLTSDVQELGATPLLFTSLTRRKFDGTQLIQDLGDVVNATRKVAAESNVKLIDLNAASRKYVQAIGSADADKYNLVAGDRTHLNAHGSEVFGRIVADLLLESDESLGPWIGRNATLSHLIEEGVYA
ncbi:carbohydrate esterase family 12 protein [Karstenula rhodostoma CBS 690.94]|uniref:Carbohydrate esterase family 12 protein n=1 Tax=Karstenula rhodostoma CBS 690.94 TaxID=1392251 RepID=A0A9P4UCL3_9PLEO|nr:carbohydrate esterase family 12 protein [Karstenula rhodostoma CBS 690.94]